MKDAQKPDHVSLTTLVRRLKEGRFVIPDFQREFEWNPWDISALVRSIFLDYYIGSLLLWKGKDENFDALACEPLYGFGGDQASPEHIVLDGQQRLTAMHYAFMAPDVPAPNRANRFIYFIRVDQFLDENYEDAFDYDWTRRTANLLDDEEAQFRDHIFPLATIGADGWAVPNWVQGYRRYWSELARSAEAEGNADLAEAASNHAEGADTFGEFLREITEQYQIAYIELDRDIAIDKVCDIFTQINSRGIRLDVFDLMNALLKPKGLQLKHMWREAESRLDFVESERLNVYVLQVMSILEQAYCSPKYLYYLLPGQEKTVRESGGLRQDVLVPDVETFARMWDNAVDALEDAIKQLRHPQEFGVISSGYLPYVSILPAFAALEASAAALEPSRQLDAQRKVRHWYWASVFTNQYSGAVESTAARDFQEVKTWFGDDDAEPSVIAEFRGRFRSLPLRSETRRGTSIYNGIFNLLVLQGARDWMSGKVPQHDELDDHHIVPKAWGSKNSVGGLVDSILNRTPLSADTNRNAIRDRLPNEYLPELIEQNSESEVRATLESHFISPIAFDILLRDPFDISDFEEFLNERQRTIQAAIEELLIKERLDLTPQLRELDERIEAVELALRADIDTRLGNDPGKLPDHVSLKIGERLNTAARKNPTLDETHYEQLIGMLEYADLRELEAAITNKANWPLFADRFGSKEQLVNRFGQLAELRNGIRHSRAVGEVARMDGEAAITWFSKTLGLS
jgi:hypothetical protein